METITSRTHVLHYPVRMPWRLQRFQQARCLHFITFSCQHRDPLLSEPSARDLFLEMFERTRRWYGFFVCGFVVMPEHVHLLISEPERSRLAVALQMLKQNTARKLHTAEGTPFWEPRYYDFNVWSEAKRIEKLRYIHRNPVRRGLVNAPRIGPGAAFDITPRVQIVWSRSNHSGQSGDGNGMGRHLGSPKVRIQEIEFQRVKIPTLSPQKPRRQGWGTPVSRNR